MITNILLAAAGTAVLFVSIPCTWYGLSRGSTATAVCAWFGIVLGFAAFLLGVVGLTIVSPWQ